MSKASFLNEMLNNLLKKKTLFRSFNNRVDINISPNPTPDVLKVSINNNKVLERFVINDIKGIKQEAYDKISKSFNIQGQYRTYDYMTAKRSAVYLEPIRVFTDED